MALIKEIDYGTPIRRRRCAGDARDRRQAGHRARRHLGHARGGRGWRAGAETVRHRQRRSRSAPAACAWSRSKGARGTPASCTTPAEAGMKVRTQSPKLAQAAQGRDGALHLRPSARLPDLRRQRQLRVAGHGRRGRACAKCATAMRAPTIWSATKDESNPYFTFDPSKCIVCSRCVRACEEVQGTFALTIDGRGFASKVAGRQHRLPRLRMRLLRRLRAGLPDRDADGEVGHRKGPARAQRRHHLRLLRRRLLVQGRDAGQRSGAHGAVTRTARPITAIPASRAASPGATRPTRTAS